MADSNLSPLPSLTPSVNVGAAAPIPPAARLSQRSGVPLEQSVLERRIFLAWALLLALLLGLGLGQVPLFDVDEGAFAEATREMLASGDWGHTTLNGEARWDKPILIYWLQAASVSLFGLNEAALRLPSALATWGWTLALAAFAWPRWGLTAALAGASVLFAQPGVLLIGRAATADALLNLWITLAALDLWRHVEARTTGNPADSTVPPAARRALRRAALFIGLGVLTKGPVALLVTAAPLLLWLACTGPQRWRLLRGLLGDPLAWGLFLLAWLPWYGYALQRHGWDFVEGFLLRHNLQRFDAPLEGHGGGIAYYLLVLPVLLLPWTALLPTLLRRLPQLWADSLSRWLLLWAGFVLVFFSLSGTKLPHYLLYGMPPLALLLGRLWKQELVTAAGPPSQPANRSQDRPRDRPTWGLALVAVSLFTLPWLLLGLSAVTQELARSRSGALSDVRLRLLLSNGPDWRGLLGPATAVTLAQVAGWWARLRLARCRSLGPSADTPSRGLAIDALPWAVGAACFTLFCTLALLPWWGAHLQGPVQRLALQTRQLQQNAPGGPATPTVVQWGLHQPSFALYLQQEVPRRTPRPGEWALVRRDRFDPARSLADPQQAWVSLAEDGAFLLLRRCATPTDAASSALPASPDANANPRTTCP